MNRTITGMLAVVLILTGIAFRQGGFWLVVTGFVNGGMAFVRIIPILVLAFLVAGLVTILISPREVSRWLGKEAGWMGPVWGAVMGALLPGGPFFFYPLMATLIASGAGMGTMISFVASKTLWSAARIPIEVAFAGVHLTAIRFAVTFFIPILTGWAVHWFMPEISRKIREDVENLQMKGRQGKKEEPS